MSTEPEVRYFYTVVFQKNSTHSKLEDFPVITAIADQSKLT